MNMDRLLESVKKHEGYRNKVYLDTLGKRTVGVGHLCVEDFWEDDKEYEEKFLMEILEKDLSEAIKGANDLMAEHDCMDIKNYIGASYEMLDSRWAKQTPNRANGMAKTMKEIT